MNNCKNCLLKVVLGFFLTSFSILSFGQVMLDKVVAIVNSQVITQAQVNQQMKITQNQMKSMGEALPSENQLREKALNQLIDEALQLDVAKKAHISVTQAQLNDALSKIASQNNISVETLIHTVTAHGITEQAYKDQIRKEMIIHEVQQKSVVPQVKLSSDDIAHSNTTTPSAKPQVQINAKTKFHVVDILFATEKRATDALASLQENRNQLKKLDDITKILKHASITVEDMNDLGVRRLSDFPVLFAQSIKSMRPGEFSSPIKAPNGYHLLLLAGSTGQYGAPTAAPMTPEQKAFQDKFNQALQGWLLKLRNQSYIKIIN